MSDPRPIQKDDISFVTRRCVQQQLWLSPDETCNDIVRYCLAVAAEKYAVDVYAFCAESNQIQAVYGDPSGTLPDFYGYFHALVARALNSHRDRSGSLWDDRQTSVLICTSPGAALDRIVHAITNPAKDHLVAHARDWPGVNSIRAMMEDTPIEVKRPAFFDKRGDLPAVARLRYARPPGYQHLEHSEWRDLLQRRVREVEAEAATERHEDGRSVLGVRRIRAQRPTSVPASAANPKASRRPKPTIKSQDAERRNQQRQARKEWRRQYREAVKSHQQNDNKTRFPIGTFKRSRECHIALADESGPLPTPFARTLRPHT